MAYSLLPFILLTVLASTHADTDAQLIALGKQIFEDTQLSEPAGQSCASCHQAEHGFGDLGRVTSPGANPSLHGNRNAPAIAYIKFNPELHWDEDEQLWIGGFSMMAAPRRWPFKPAARC